LDQLDRLGRHIRKEPSKPFGGLIVLTFGDFLELPPFDFKSKRSTSKKDVYYHSYAFESKVWQEHSPVYLYLNVPNRKFKGADLEMIQALRYGKHEDLNTNPKFHSLCANDRVSIDDLALKECYLVPSGVVEFNNGRLLFKNILIHLHDLKVQFFTFKFYTIFASS
jgi:hypothetical protein